MEAKYYTPKAEEFHLGFEFECHIDNGLISKSHYKEGQEWKRTEWGIFDYIKTRELSLVRVKHLDQEDIEELGWKREGLVEFALNGFIIEVSYGDIQSDTIDIFQECNPVFCGKIKNKSELKRLMVQLGITKE